MSKYQVIDASFAFRLLLPGPHQKRCQALVTQWHRDGYILCAPTLLLTSPHPVSQVRYQ